MEDLTNPMVINGFWIFWEGLRYEDVLAAVKEHLPMLIPNWTKSLPIAGKRARRPRSQNAGRVKNLGFELNLH